MSLPNDPTMALPIETLSQILLHLHTDARPGFNDRHRLGWIVFTHICGRWRMAGLNMPHLWAYDVCSIANVLYMKMMTKRAQGQGLVLDISRLKQSMTRDYKARDTGRLMGPSSKLNDILASRPGVWELLHTLLPQAHTIIDTRIQRSARDLECYEDLYPILWEDIIADGLNQLIGLTHLDVELTRKSYIVPASTSTHLVYLSLRSKRLAGTHSQPFMRMNDVAAMLRSNAALEHLGLHNIICPDSTGPASVTFADLSSLKSLSLTCDTEAVLLYFCGCTLLNPSTNVDIRVETLTSGSVKNILQLFISHSFVGAPPRYPRLRFHLYHWNSRNTEECRACLMAPNGPGFLVSVGFPATAMDWALKDAFSDPICSQIYSLHLHSPPDISENSLAWPPLSVEALNSLSEIAFVGGLGHMHILQELSSIRCSKLRKVILILGNNMGDVKEGYVQSCLQHITRNSGGDGARQISVDRQPLRRLASAPLPAGVYAPKV